jgi:death-on-curing protein
MSTLKKEPKWLDHSAISILHAEALSVFGGTPGVKSEGLLDAAVEQPYGIFRNDSARSLFHLAATYAIGLACNPPYRDGNLTTAALAIRAFLHMNGWTFNPEPAHLAVVIEGVADGTFDEDILAGWIQRNSRRTKKTRK